MKLHVIVKLAPIGDDRQLRDKLGSYGIDFTDLLTLALESLGMDDSDREESGLLPLVDLLDPRHRVKKRIVTGRIDYMQYAQLNAWLDTAITPLQAELYRLVHPFAEWNFAQQAVSYRLKRFLHRCDGLIVEVTLRRT